MHNQRGGVNGLSIQSWDDFATKCPKSPLELIAYADFNTDVGVLENSATFNTPVYVWSANTIALGGNSITALGTDNKLKIVDALNWNFSHKTWDGDSAIAPPLKDMVFLRGGLEWQNDLVIELGGTTYTNLPLSFLYNAATRGDKQGTVPVSTFSGNYTGTVSLKITLKTFGQVCMGLRAIAGCTEAYSMYAMTRNVVV